MARDDIRRYSRDQLEQIVAKGDYVATRPDAPEINLGEEFWRTSRVVMPSPEPKKHTGVRMTPTCWRGSKPRGAGGRPA
jgi:hypothetical protein